MSNPNIQEKSNLDRKVSQYMSVNLLILDELIKMPLACKLMNEKHKDEIIVRDKTGKLTGIVTDEDILKNIGESHIRSSRTTLGDIMQFPLIGVKHSESLQKALEVMLEKKIRKLVVYSDNDEIIGMIYYDVIHNIVHSQIVKPKHPTFRSILWNLATVLQFAGVLMIIPSFLSTLLGETNVATGIFLMATTLLISGFLLNSYGERHNLGLRGMAILVFSSFVILVLFGTIPYLYLNPYHSQSFVDLFSNSFFSSTAGFTTAGISLFTKPETLPQSFTFFRGFSQFVGGLSFIYLIMTAFYPEKKLNSMRGFISGEIPKLRELFSTITIVFTIYALIIAGFLFYFGERNFIDDISIAMSTLSTGGFVPNSDILSTLTPPEYIILFVGMILGSLPFGFHYGFIRTKFLSIKITREVGIYFLVLITGIILFIPFMSTSIIDAIFTVISTSTTTGFQTIDLGTLNQSQMILLMFLMIIGGCGFSTAGGLKIFRIIHLFNIKKFIKKSKTLTENNKKEIVTSLILLLLLPSIPFVVALHLNSLGNDFYDSYFEAVGAITTAGIGTGIINIDLDAFTKILVSFLMILGRLEILVLIYIFLPKLM